MIIVPVKDGENIERFAQFGGREVLRLHKV